MRPLIVFKKSIVCSSPVAAILLSLFVFMISCGSEAGGDNDPPGNVTETTNATETIVEYYGTATVTILYESYDFQGNLEYSYRKTHYKNVLIQKKPPEKAGAIVEKNAFNLIIQSDDTEIKQDGDFYFISSRQGNVDLGPTAVLMEYWTLNYNNGRIGGVLTNTHKSESLAFNTVWAWDRIIASSEGIFPFMMDTQSTLTGTLDDSNASLTIQGQASSADFFTDHAREFYIEISASRR